jgi:hypothetical protein
MVPEDQRPWLAAVKPKSFQTNKGHMGDPDFDEGIKTMEQQETTEKGSLLRKPEFLYGSSQVARFDFLSLPPDPE